MARIDGTGVDIRRLRYFLAVCDHGGFSRAAGAVGIAQPALTRQIQLLEQELGVTLFTRNGRSAVPSEAGQMLLSEARNHLHSLDMLVDRLRMRYAEGPQHLTLGICPTIAPLFLEPLQEGLRGVPGAPVLTVIEAYSGDLRSLMQAGRLDLALSYAPSDAEGVWATPLLDERLVLVTRSPLIRGPVDLSDLAGLKLILPGRLHELRRIIDAAFAAQGLAMTPALVLNSLAAVKAMLLHDGDAFATILPELGAAQEGGVRLWPIRDAGMVRTIALLQPAAQRHPLPEVLIARIAARAAAIRAAMAPLPQDA